MSLYNAAMSFILKAHHSTMASTNQPLLHQTTQPKPFCKILFFSVSIFAILVSALFLLPNHLTTTDNDYLSTSSPSYVCRKALNPKTCRKLVLQQISENGAKPSNPTDLLQKFLINQSNLLNKAFLQTNNLKNHINEQKEQSPLSDCLQLLDQSIELVSDSIEALTNQAHADAQAWLSGVLTNHVTCSDGLSSRSSIMPVLEELVSMSSATLAVLAVVSEEDKEMGRNLWGSLPSWVTAADRRLMGMSGNAVKADLTVAQDGSGTHRKVGDAIAAAPEKSKTRYVIYVKKGTYKENVEVGKNKKNVMLVGDGVDSTIITGDLNYVDGATTFNSATLAAVGEGFILQDIRIQNTAGPEKHQAVALRVGADKSVINRCRIEAYQDTLYTHSLRQFYRDTHIRGTIDFIFGNAAVVFQKCTLEARKPMKSQKNMVTAQGRTDPNQNTGTSIQDSEIKAGQDLEPVKASFPTYLGRPWKEYSRTAVMQTYIGDLIDPAGWAEWSGTFALDTLYYGEYMNRGPGAGTSKRVTWKGYHVITSSAEAMKFTVKELIQGADWIAAAGVAFIEGL